MQDRPQVAEVEKHLREQVGTVALDERDELLPIGRIGEPLGDAEPQRAAVREPAAELRLGEILQRVDEHVVRRADLELEIVAQLALIVPVVGRRDEAAHDRLVAAGEEPVVLGDRAGPDRVLGFHRLGDVEQLARLAHQPQPRQPFEQVLNQLHERPRPHDPPRLAALGRAARRATPAARARR